MVVMWAEKDRLASKVMPSSLTEVTSGSTQSLMFKFGVVGMGPIHNMLHLCKLVTFIANRTVTAQGGEHYCDPRLSSANVR